MCVCACVCERERESARARSVSEEITQTHRVSFFTACFKKWVTRKIVYISLPASFPSRKAQGTRVPCPLVPHLRPRCLGDGACSPTIDLIQDQGVGVTSTARANDPGCISDRRIALYRIHLFRCSDTLLLLFSTLYSPPRCSHGHIRSTPYHHAIA